MEAMTSSTLDAWPLAYAVVVACVAPLFTDLAVDDASVNNKRFRNVNHTHMSDEVVNPIDLISRLRALSTALRLHG